MRQRPTRKRERAKQLIDQDITARSSLQQQAPAEHPQQFWLIELWKENRGIFKELTKHILFFLLLLGSLIGLHEIIDRSRLPPGQKEVLDKMHFYELIIMLLIFSCSFIIKVIIFEFQKTRE